MLSKIKLWLYSKLLSRNDIESPIAKDVIEQTNTRDTETKKRVAKAFKAQEEQMNARALKAHSCQDPIGCRKKKCFKFTPDKIVSEPYEVKKK